MRLSKIKLAGFKSFVDPTTISFPSNLVGVVGPNGCGKSNVIDAVRWVMGESSASRLRGDSMTDVIFNGSSARQPVGTASIELLFDNSDGTVGGQYAKYAELSIRRSVSRDGLSTYFLNGAKCRRKDITGIFLGTGLGPRSYSIIEQGMISRIIEAKPEEMRVYIEEAAGISKYKERRRETETRIRHTRENLERLTDLLEEVEKQIKHLDRQAKAAERYKKHKAEERRTAAELLGLRLRELDERTEEHERALAECETRLQAAIAEQRSAEAMIEEQRDRHTEATDSFNDVQGRFYKVGAEIARLEQAIEHGRELRERQLADLEQAREGAKEILEHIEKDESELEQLELALNELAPGLEQAQAREQRSSESLRRAEAAMAEWRERWEAVNSELHEAQQTSEVEAARIEQFENLAARLDRQRKKISGDSEEISLDSLRQTMAEVSGESAAGASAVREADERLAAAKSRIDRARERERRMASELLEHQSSLQTTLGRYTAAKALQDAALGKDGAQTGAWLSESGLANRPRLAQQLQVEAGWERAVETVLGDYLQAISVDSLDEAARKLNRLNSGNVVLMQASLAQNAATGGNLAAKVRQAPAGVLQRLSKVRTAASLQAGLAVRAQLHDGESLITQQGEWISRDFLRVNRAGEEAGGVLERVKEIRALRERMKQQQSVVDEEEKALARARDELKNLEEAGDKAQSDAANVHRAHSELAAQADTVRFRVTEAEQRWLSFQQESRDIDEEVSSTADTINQSRRLLEEARANVSAQSERKSLLESQRAQLAKELERVSAQASEDREATKAVAIRYETRLSSKDSASQTLVRMQSQLAQFQSREKTLTAQLEGEETPLAEKSAQLESELSRRVAVEQELSAARKQLEEIDARLREFEQQRGDAEDRVVERREASNAARMSAQETRVRREGIFEQFKATGFALAETLAELADDATVELWEENLNKLIRRIERLGPINLAAIDEFKEQSERKEYLDAQLADLQSALETLENAIRKIDRETRTRFKETYDNIDSGFKRLFPKLFGGGHAYLELTGDDLLSAGVTVMARPPGKRNSTIHLLSGGEKALTAVALVFAIFELNPAPFCLLDEVDAPLDDANVARYCEIVKEMSEHVQFVFITHNKVTMEMARQLSGVTMQEPGVSRLVTVDLDEAVQMAVS